MEVEKLRAEVLELLCYIVTSARGLVDEPWRYGPFRLIETARRLIAIMQHAGLDDEFLRRVATKIDNHDVVTRNDGEGLIRFLDDLVFLLANELKEI
ncbi:MAG: hypothetical protein FJ014_08495 [Chloroflexi bacterium]|nr:hypothetical protein [Chloroflexota bacterium]